MILEEWPITKLPTQVLKRHIEKCIRETAPLFGIDSTELDNFPRWRLLRTPPSNASPDFNPESPGYHCLERYFYFPPDNSGHKSLVREGFPVEIDAFHVNTIRHEVSHFLHDMVNPEIRDFHTPPVDLGVSVAVRELMETVADYPNYIICPQVYDRYPRGFINLYHRGLDIAKQRGPEFLPALARMPIKEVLLSDIFKYAKIN